MIYSLRNISGAGVLIGSLLVGDNETIDFYDDDTKQTSNVDDIVASLNAVSPNLNQLLLVNDFRFEEDTVPQTNSDFYSFWNEFINITYPQLLELKPIVRNTELEGLSVGADTVDENDRVITAFNKTVGNIDEIAGTDGQSLRLPVGAESQRPVPAEQGMIRLNSDNKEVEYYSGDIWAGLITTAGTASINHNVLDVYINNGQTVNTGSFQPFQWNSIRQNDPIYDFTVNDQDVTINKTGRFKLTANMTAVLQSGNARTETNYKLQISTNGGSTFNDIPGCFIALYHRNGTQDGNSGSMSCIIDVNFGDVVRVVGFRNSGSSTIQTLANGCNFMIEESEPDIEGIYGGLAKKKTFMFQYELDGAISLPAVVSNSAFNHGFPVPFDMTIKYISFVAGTMQTTASTTVTVEARELTTNSSGTGAQYTVGQGTSRGTASISTTGATGSNFYRTSTVATNTGSLTAGNMLFCDINNTAFVTLSDVRVIIVCEGV